ncbi:MAG: beta-propeller domain-containing protein [Burkholderiaceae bacterium]
MACRPAGSGGATAGPPQASAATDGAARYSETNVRLAGVDEPDPVKTDGRRLFTLRHDAGGTSLSALALTPPADLALLGQVRWSGSPPLINDGRAVAPELPQGLMLIGDRSDALLTISASARSYAFPVPAIGWADSGVAADMICADIGCGPGDGRWAPPRTRIRRFDVSADAAPTEQWLLDVPGALLAARRIGSTLYLVTQAALRLPDGVRNYPQLGASDAAIGSAVWNAAAAATMAENERLIRAMSLADWFADLTTIERVGAASATAREIDGGTPTAEQCAAFARIDADTRLAWLRITAIDIDTRESRSKTLLAQGQSILMTERSLIVFTPYWRHGEERFNPRELTLLHRFSREPAGQLTYQASGQIAGRLINDYAVDEAADGTIRVAATDWNGRASSYVATLRAEAGKFVTIGKTDPIAVGETLQSARFVGDRAYLVTFRNIDPFFVFDLTDASAPRQLGELKLPGFSTYLHPVDADHLLGIGYDGGGWPSRLKATLFDVRDPGNPREAASVALGDSYTGSDAVWDPHAFTFYRPLPDADPAIVAVPVRSYASSLYRTQTTSGIRLLRVAPSEPAAPLALTGTLSMTDLLDDALAFEGWRNADARRAVFVGNTVYGISDTAVRAADLADPATPVATVGIP